MLTRLFNWSCQRSPAAKRWLWRRWYQFLAKRYDARAWSFMNYGYASLDAAAAPLGLEAHDEDDRYCIQLYHHVASGADLTHRDVLEVGSGRGGGASYIKRYLGPQKMVGVDFSAHAVAFSRKTHAVPELEFLEGDAEELPFGAGTFDAVVNVESSHCYGNFEKFLSEVSRVLRPGGAFLFADLRTQEALPQLRQQLQQSGLTLSREADISANVVRALELDDPRKRTQIRAFIGKRWAGTFSRFAGVKGSPIYEEFRTGAVAYSSFVLHKEP